MIQQLAVIGCNATISSQLVESQTSLMQFVVDLWICCRHFNLHVAVDLLYSKSTTNHISGDWA